MELIINKEFEELRLKMSTEEKIIIKEAKAWAIKYLIAVSEEQGFKLIIRRGIKLIKLISSPSQHVNHEEEEEARKVPKINEKK